jgi:phosphatidate phosphatase APP1
MSDWRKAVAIIASNVEEHYDKLKFRLHKKLSGVGPVKILPYIGHGTQKTIYVQGRAVEDYNVVSAHDNDTIWQNILNMYHRFNSHEIPRALVKIRFGDEEQEVKADEEGFFKTSIELSESLPPEKIWFDVEYELVEYSAQESSKTTGQVLVPPATARFGVVSDLDDTVIQTDVVNLVKLARNTFLYNSRTRLPFAGVAEFYHALQRGTQDEEYNPIFYVSSAAWNTYDLIVDFFEVRGIPLGPLFMTQIGLTPDQLLRPSHFDHKLGRIRMLLQTHPDLPFILIGDSSEKDPEIYLQAVTEHPGRVPVIYIRDVTGHRRDEAMKVIIEKVKEAGAEMLFVPDTAAAAVDAVERGFISADSLPAIREERKEDKKPPEPIEELLGTTP